MATKKPTPAAGTYRATVQAALDHVLQQVEDLEGRHAAALAEFETSARELEDVQAAASPHRPASQREYDATMRHNKAQQAIGDLQRDLIDLRRDKAALSAKLHAPRLLAEAKAELQKQRNHAATLRRELVQVEAVAGKLQASVRGADEALAAELQAHATAMVRHGGPLPTPDSLLRQRADLEGQRLAWETAADRAQLLRAEVAATEGLARDARDEVVVHQAAVAEAAALEVVHQHLAVFAAAAAAQANAGRSLSGRYVVEMPVEAVSAAREALWADSSEQSA